MTGRTAHPCYPSPPTPANITPRHAIHRVPRSAATPTRRRAGTAWDDRDDGVVDRAIARPFSAAPLRIVTGENRISAPCGRIGLILGAYLLADVGVDLRGRQVHVSEQRLDIHELGAGLEEARRSGGDRLPGQTDLRMNPFPLLQEGDHLEKVAGLWVALGPQHPHQALGWPPGLLAQPRSRSWR